MDAQPAARGEGLALAVGNRAVTTVLGLSRLSAPCLVRLCRLITRMDFLCQVPQTAGLHKSLKSSSSSRKTSVNLEVRLAGGSELSRTAARPAFPVPSKGCRCPRTFAPCRALTRGPAASRQGWKLHRATCLPGILAKERWIAALCR